MFFKQVIIGLLLVTAHRFFQRVHGGTAITSTVITTAAALGNAAARTVTATATAGGCDAAPTAVAMIRGVSMQVHHGNGSAFAVTVRVLICRAPECALRLVWGLITQADYTWPTVFGRMTSWNA